MNYDWQTYRGLRLQLKNRTDYKNKRAKEYQIINTRGFLTDYTVWIPNSYHVDDIGTLDISKNFMFIFNKTEIIKKLNETGYEFTY